MSGKARIYAPKRTALQYPIEGPKHCIDSGYTGALNTVCVKYAYTNCVIHTSNSSIPWAELAWFRIMESCLDVVRPNAPACIIKNNQQRGFRMAGGYAL